MTSSGITGVSKANPITHTSLFNNIAGNQFLFFLFNIKKTIQIVKFRFNPNNVAATVTDYKAVGRNDENGLLEAVGTVGPVSIAVDASLNTFMFYAYGK